MVHLQMQWWLPSFVLMPTRVQAMHIGVEGGMHKMSAAKKKRLDDTSFERDFHAIKLYEPRNVPRRKAKKGFGGWGHPADHAHCIRILGVKEAVADKEEDREEQQQQQQQQQQ